MAEEVHHKQPCGDNVALQTSWENFEALCRPCHQPLKGDAVRGFSKALGPDGFAIDPRHPSNRPRPTCRTGRSYPSAHNVTPKHTASDNTGGRVKHKRRSANRPAGKPH